MNTPSMSVGRLPSTRRSSASDSQWTGATGPDRYGWPAGSTVCSRPGVPWSVMAGRRRLLLGSDLLRVRLREPERQEEQHYRDVPIQPVAQSLGHVLLGG